MISAAAAANVAAVPRLVSSVPHRNEISTTPCSTRRWLKPRQVSFALPKWINRLKYRAVRLGWIKNHALEHNAHNSRLYQLPDELLLCIMSWTPQAGIYLFRMTCSRFYHAIDEKAHALQHNVLNSRLYQLPDELILRIMSYTLFSGIALFRMTCSRFYYVVDQDARSLDRKGRFFVERMIFRDHFLQICEFERGLTGSLSSKSEFLCAPCRYHHPKSKFLPEELFKNSEIRSCIGAQGVLRICAHLEFTHATLRAKVLEQYGRSGSFTLECTHLDHDPRETVFGTRYAPTLSRFSPTLSRFSFGREEDWHWIRSRREILRIPYQQSMSRLRIANVIKELDPFLCPHLRIDDAAITDCIPALNCPSTRYHCRFIGTCVHCKPTSKACVAPHCRTNFLLYRCPPEIFYSWNRNDDYDSVILLAFRYLGTLLDATDDQWCSQIVTL